jgi:regulator of ribonuclease activity A
MSTRATADLYDEHGESLQSCDCQLRQYGAVRSFSGTITTLRCFEDNALAKSVLGEDGKDAFSSSTAAAPSTPPSWVT